MGHIPQTNHGRIDRSFGTMQRLMFENARLSRLCMEATGMAARHELMLREGDHRIKNSLQVVASLLGLQARRETSEAAQDATRAAAARIQAVARIHDALQLNGDGEPDIGALIAAMSASLRDMAEVSDNGVGLPAGYAHGGGYGMTLVRAMIAKIGGRLDAETSSGVRFTLSAPLARLTAPSTQSHATADPPQGMAAC